MLPPYQPSSQDIDPLISWLIPFFIVDPANVTIFLAGLCLFAGGVFILAGFGALLAAGFGALADTERETFWKKAFKFCSYVLLLSGFAATLFMMAWGTSLFAGGIVSAQSSYEKTRMTRHVRKAVMAQADPRYSRPEYLQCIDQDLPQKIHEVYGINRVVKEDENITVLTSDPYLKDIWDRSAGLYQTMRADILVGHTGRIMKAFSRGDFPKAGFEGAWLQKTLYPGGTGGAYSNVTDYLLNPRMKGKAMMVTLSLPAGPFCKIEDPNACAAFCADLSKRLSQLDALAQADIVTAKACTKDPTAIDLVITPYARSKGEVPGLSPVGQAVLQCQASLEKAP